jgi:putative SOS response-associated peptidase YedK
MKFIGPKLYAGIDYEFGPQPFWTAASDPLAAILRNVKGRNRREMIRDYYAAGKLGQLSDELCGQIHNKMPVILPEEYRQKWLSGAAGK